MDRSGGPGWPSRSRSRLGVNFSCSRGKVELMYSTLLIRTTRRAVASSHLPPLTRTFSVKTGPRPPKNSTQGPSSSTTDDAHLHAPSSPSQSASTGAPNVSEPGSPTAPISATTTSLSLDFAPPEPGAGRERTGAKSSKDSLSSIERRRRQLGRVGFGLFAVGLLGGCIYLGREWTLDEIVSRKAVRQLFFLCACPHELTSVSER
jgi:hypothetical protein